MHELIIEPGRAEKNYWRDLWRYRELFYILAWRDISVRYKQTVIGVAWVLFQPIVTPVRKLIGETFCPMFWPYSFTSTATTM